MFVSSHDVVAQRRQVMLDKVVAVVGGSSILYSEVSEYAEALVAQRRQMDGKVQFQAESDALIVKGIVALLVRVLNNQTPQDILDADLYFIEQIGLREHLSPTRSNGLLAMLKQMKMYALVFSQKAGA